MTKRNYDYYAVCTKLLKDYGIEMEYHKVGPKTFITKLGDKKYKTTDAKVALTDLDTILEGIIEKNKRGKYVMKCSEDDLVEWWY